MTPRKKKTATKAPAKRPGRPKKPETETPVETEAAAPAAPKKKRKAVKSAAKETEGSQMETPPPEPKPTASGHKDPNVGKEGFGPCAACGWWGPNGATLCHHCGMPRSGRPLSAEEKAAREATAMTETEMPESALEETETEEEIEEDEPEEEAPEYYQVELSMTVALHDALVAQAQSEGRDFHDILVRAVELGAIQMRESGELTDLPEKAALEYDDQEDIEFQEAFEMAAR